MLGNRIKMPGVELQRIVREFSKIPANRREEVLHVFEHCLTSHILARMLAGDVESVHSLIHRMHSKPSRKMEMEIVKQCSSELSTRLPLIADEAVGLTRLMLSYWNFTVRKSHSAADVWKGTHSLAKILIT